MRTLKKTAFFLIAVFLFAACFEDVPHENPLDPAYDDHSVQVSGHVFTFYHPRSTIAGATIQIEPGDGITISGTNGSYEIHHLTPGSYTIYCTAEGYHLDSTTIELKTDVNQDFFLDGSPQFKEIIIGAHHHSRWFPREEIYFLRLETRVTDPDGIGDINSVILTMPSLAFKDTLPPGVEAGYFSIDLYDEDLPVASIHQLIGHEIYFEVVDDFGTSLISPAYYITRIIEQTPILSSPSGLEILEGNEITFRWEGLALAYPASLRIDIFQISLGIARKVAVLPDLPISKKYHRHEHSLDPGDYFWTLNIVDEFGNVSGSREGTFKIK